MKRPRRAASKGVNYSDEQAFAVVDRVEQKDQENYEKNLAEVQKAYGRLEAKRKKRRVGDQGESQTIYYVKGPEKNPEIQEVTAFSVDKVRVRDAYEDAQYGRLQQQYYFVPSTSGEQFFSLQSGNDFVFYSLKQQEIEVPRPDKKKRKPKKTIGFRREGNTGPSYAEVAATADLAVQWVLDNIEGYDTLKDARERVGSDINRLAGRLEPRIAYPGKYLWTRAGLKSFAFIIRADKSRVPEATPYIESVLKGRTKSFTERFGNDKPIYVGTGSGVGSGPSRLREQASEDGYDSEYSGDEKD